MLRPKVVVLPDFQMLETKTPFDRDKFLAMVDGPTCEQPARNSIMANLKT